MISTDFERLLQQSFPKSIELGMGERFSHLSSIIKDVGTPKTAPEQEVIVLTISGHLFRLLVALVFNKDNQIRTEIEQAQNKKASEIDDEAFYDYMNEVGNVICGSLKRELHKATPSLGMSTPNLLKHDSFKYIDSMKIDDKGRFDIQVNQQSFFQIDYYLSAYGPLEIDQNIHIEEEETDSGELEFF
jgi:CheY-specific phosphatase CheX